jgi:aldose 1-epimerase
MNFDPISKSQFGTTADGAAASVFTLTNSHGAQAVITDYGGAVVTLKVPDRLGEFGDVVLGFDTLAEYEQHRRFFGALIGRYANRIADAVFVLNGHEYRLAANNGKNHLHGGIRGFDRVVWSAKPSPGAAELELFYSSEDGEEGYPGNLDATVRYTLTEENELEIQYSAITDQETIVNLTNHSYFNLSGAGNDSILGNEISINADRYTPTDDTSIPTGELASVEGTPFDLREPKTIVSRITEQHQQLEFGRGFDHNFVLNKTENELSLAAAVYDPLTGRFMEVQTTEPGIQFYSGNFLDGSLTGKGGHKYKYRSALCLEAQHFPDSPNRPEFPSTVLRPGEEYSQTTIYKFSTRP